MAETRLWRWLQKWRERRGLAPGAQPSPLTWRNQVFLHVGCGQASKAQTTPGFQGDDWQEIRLDIDPFAQPDLLASMLDMHLIGDGAVDAIYSSHNIEPLTKLASRWEFPLLLDAERGGRRPFLA